MKVSELLENENLPIFRAIYPVCAEAHKDQKRKDGKPYMTHVDAVMEGAYDEYIAECDAITKRNPTSIYWIYLDICLSVAAAHDVLEDQPEKITLTQLVDIFKTYTKSVVFFKTDMNNFSSALTAISKKIDGDKTYVDYADYVKNVKRNDYSRIVKIADLKHNMSDLSDGNLKEKYQLTLAVLEGIFV